MLFFSISRRGKVLLTRRTEICTTVKKREQLFALRHIRDSDATRKSVDFEIRAIPKLRLNTAVVCTQIRTMRESVCELISRAECRVAVALHRDALRRNAFINRKRESTDATDARLLAKLKARLAKSNRNLSRDATECERYRQRDTTRRSDAHRLISKV